jgi:hypothetical protein
MAISRTYGQIQKQIADELGDRQDLLSPLSDSTVTLSPIKNAIQSAVSKWERESFYFNEAYTQNLFSTISGQEFYGVGGSSVIATSPYLLRLHVLVDGNRYPLILRTWDYLDDISSTPTGGGMPVDYAYFAQQLRFYPIPDAAYAITISGTNRVPALVSDDDANIWTSDAFDLIKSEAKLILAREVLFDDDLAARMERAIYGDPMNPRERGYLSVLKSETMRRGRGKIIPSQF